MTKKAIKNAALSAANKALADDGKSFVQGFAAGVKWSADQMKNREELENALEDAIMQLRSVLNSIYNRSPVPTEFLEGKIKRYQKVLGK